MTSSARPTLRERQRDETHGLIRRTTYELAVERGVSAVSVQSICAAAGVSTRTFFNHFRSKDEALIPDLPDFPDAAQRAFVDGVDPDLLTALEELLGEHIAWVQERADGGEGPRAMKRLLEANPELVPRAMAVFEALEQRVAALVARRTGRPSVDLFCTVAALTATSAMRAAFGTWEDGSADGAELRPAVSSAFAVLRELLAPPEPT
jgi:AcrR family transcriptional regulator